MTVLQKRTFFVGGAVSCGGVSRASGKNTFPTRGASLPFAFPFVFAVLAALAAAYLAAACFVATCFIASTPHQAFAYFNRGSVGVELGASSIELNAGEQLSVSVSFSPTSDAQTAGCGMAMCPQMCASTCADENGQCTCGGTEYTTYYPSAKATSSDASIATASYSQGTLTVVGRSEGTATITVQASLRQFTDGEATLHVTVAPSENTGENANAQTTSNEAVETPEAALETLDDRQDFTEKTVMGRPIHTVRITDGLDASSYLLSMAGIDGEVTFWQGDTSYHPNYSITFQGTGYTAADVVSPDVQLLVYTTAQGTLNQALSGLDSFVAIEFSQTGALVGEAQIYADSQGALADGTDVHLYSYNTDTKSFVLEDAEAMVSGGYVVFSVSEGKIYVVSSRDLTREANEAVSGGTQSSDAQTGDADTSKIDAQTFPLWALVLVAVLVGGGIAAFAVLRRRKAQVKGSDSFEQK